MSPTPTEKVVAAWLSHALVLAAVLPITVLGLGESPPPIFIAAEGMILIFLATLVFSYEAFAEAAGKLFLASRSTELAHLFSSWQKRGFPVAISLTFVLQYVALTSLLLQTGGPLNSPFSPLILLYAVFSVLFANSARGVLICMVLSVTYFLILVSQYGYEVIGERPGPWTYAAVMTVAIALISGLVVLSRTQVTNEQRQQDQAGRSPASRQTNEH